MNPLPYGFSFSLSLLRFGVAAVMLGRSLSPSPALDEPTSPIFRRFFFFLHSEHSEIHFLFYVNSSLFFFIKEFSFTKCVWSTERIKKNWRKLEERDTREFVQCNQSRLLLFIVVRDRDRCHHKTTFEKNFFLSRTLTSILTVAFIFARIQKINQSRVFAWENIYIMLL